MDYNTRISICMMIKDEGKNLEKCLKGLLPIIDSGLAELIIVDTGSKDDSVEIAERYTNKVYKHDWTNNFSEMRNISISYAKKEWIWIIDADEELENPEEVITLFKQDLTQYNTVGIKMKNYMESFRNDKEPKYNISFLVRIFRNAKDFRYEGSIHEQPKFKSPILTSNIIFKHYGYIWEDEEFTNKKFERTARLLKQELKKNPSNIYYQYQLSVSTAIIDKKQGLDEFRKSYELIRKVPHMERYKYIYIYGTYSINALRNEEYKEVIKICQEGLKLNKDYIDLWYCLYTAYTHTNDDENILRSGNGYLHCKEGFHDSPVSNDPSLTIYYFNKHSEEIILYGMVAIYIKRKEYDLALMYANKIENVELKSKAIINIGKEPNVDHIIIDYLRDIKEDEDRVKFINILETQNIKEVRKIPLQEEIIKLYEEKDIKGDPYYLLNVVRQQIIEKRDVSEDIVKKILNLNYDELGDYYGDIVFYIIKQNLNLQLFESMGESINIDRFIQYAMNKYKDFYKDINRYLSIYDIDENISNLRYWIPLARNVLIQEKLDDYSYIRLFRKYIAKGLKYIQNIYSSNILKDDDMIYDIYSREHRFFIYLQKASAVKERNIKIYIVYLRKALKVYPMKKGIELLLNEVKEITYIQGNNREIAFDEKQEEFKELKDIVKKNIKILMKEQKIAEVKAIIDEYLKIIPSDLEMLALKSEMVLKQM